jgi:hypothetical protein
MKRLTAVSALIVGFVCAVFLLGVVIAALTNLCAPVGLGLQQAAAAGPPVPGGTLYSSPKLDPRPTDGRIPTGSKTVVTWPRSCGRADRASVAFVIEPRQPTKARTVVTWPRSCGRNDRASVAFVNHSQEPTKAVGAKQDLLAPRSR